MRHTLAIAAMLLAGCGILENNNSASDTKFLLPNKTLNLSNSLQIPLEGIALAAAVYFIVDPLAPNWQVTQERLAEGRYRLSLRMKRFTTGGDGEALQVFNRNAERIAREGGFAGFRVLQYTEGIESNVLIAQRVGEGMIQMVQAPN